MPSGLVITTEVLFSFDTQNTLPFHAMLFHAAWNGKVLAVHAIPSGLVAALELATPYPATARNFVPFQKIRPQDAADGMVR
jgi:hypothetical protein